MRHQCFVTVDKIDLSGVPAHRRSFVADIPPRCGGSAGCFGTSAYDSSAYMIALIDSNIATTYLATMDLELLEELFYVGDVLREAVRWEGFQEDAAVALALDAGV